MELVLFSLKRESLMAIAELECVKMPSQYVIEKNGVVKTLPHNNLDDPSCPAAGGYFLEIDGDIIHALPQQIPNPDGYVIYGDDVYNFRILKDHIFLSFRIGCRGTYGNDESRLIEGFPYPVDTYSYTHSNTGETCAVTVDDETYKVL